MGKKLIPIALCGALILTLFASLHPSITVAQEGATLWQAWESKDLAAMTDDGSGSTFGMSDAVTTPAGGPALEIVPNGTSEETKVAVPLSGADLEAWATHGKVELEVYLPEGNTLNPNNFFMGMADVGGEWAWVGGIFGEAASLQPGWNRVVYTPDAAMRAPTADHSYMLFLSFFSADEAGTKTPLTEPFYLGSAYLSEPVAVEGETGGESGGAAAEGAVWQAWENKDIATLTDDNSGSTFAVSEEVPSPAGSPTLQVTPSGTAEETKVAFPFSGADAQELVTYSQVQLEVYLPEENALNPNRFFMGMADVGGEWTWVGGIFGEAEVQPGWNTVTYTLDPAMRAPVADHSYSLFLSFFNADEAENKVPLTEPFYLGSATFTGAEGGGEAAVEAVVWQAWETKNAGQFGHDNTFTDFAAGDAVPTPAVVPSLQVTPSGTTEETKMAFPVSGANLQSWSAGQIELEIYLPTENALNPNRVFMGIADNTTEWAWVGGIFGEFQGDAEWTTIKFVLDPIMREINPNGTYFIYFAFFNEDENANKQILSEPFYLGSITVSAAPEAETSATGSSEVTSVFDREVQLLLGFDDVALIDAIAHETFDFFWYEANPANGLVKDRSTDDSPSSIASVGFALAAIPIGIDRGWISEEQGYERALITLQTFANGGVQGDHGFFYHFVSMETGERVWSSEISSIDSSLFIAGALVAAQYFPDTEVATLAQQLYENMDWEWMMAGGNNVSMGWKPDIGFLSAKWDHFDESLLLYILATGSPTHPVPAESWADWDRPVNLQGEYIYLGGEPLFVYQYPLAFFDLRGKEDAYANYFNNTIRACERNREFSADNAENFATYANGVWGISASDGPGGYRAYGADGGNHDGTVAPYASVACLPFTPEAAFEGMRAMLTNYGSKVWGEYGFVSAINADREWYSVDHIGIDQGDILLMIANYQDGFIWNLMMQNEHIQNGLNQMGFVESTGDYAVTPAYLEAFKSGN